MLDSEIPMPAVPLPETASSILPSQSEYLVTKVDTSMPLLWHWGEIDTKIMIEPRIGGRVRNDGQDPPPGMNEVVAMNGLPIPSYSVVSRTYWKNAGGITIAPNDKREYDTSYTHGVSTTDTTSWSAALSVQDGGFEAKLSESFSQSITVNSSETKEWKDTIVGDPNRYTNFNLWIPVVELVVLDNYGLLVVTRHEDRTAILGIPEIPFARQEAGIILLSTIWTMPIDHPFESKKWFS